MKTDRSDRTLSGKLKRCIHIYIKYIIILIYVRVHYLVIVISYYVLLGYYVLSKISNSVLAICVVNRSGALIRRYADTPL